MQCILSISLVPWIAETEWARIGLTSLGCFGYAFFGYPVIAALVDSLILRVLADKKDLYGRQKIGVPIGFASSVFITGFLTEKLDSMYALFIVFTLSNLAFIVTVYFTDIEPCQDEYKPFIYGSTTSPIIVDTNDEIPVQPPSPSLLKSQSMWSLLKDPDAVQFFTFMTGMGFCIAIVQAFLYLYFENDLHGTPFMVGFFGPLGSSTELIAFYFSKQVNNL